jgi:release factor glutamine methyltransferase
MLVKEVISFGELELKKNQILNAKLDSEILISDLINIPRNSIFSQLNKKIDEEIVSKFKQYIDRRVKKEPIAYIVKKKEFWSHDFYVNDSVLIPRPETEVLLDVLLSKINNKDKFLNILDIGTGSGCIIISLLKELKKSKGLAIDKSKKAIEVAKKNAKFHSVNNRLNLQNISFEDLFLGKKFDILVSNPPYLPDYLIKNLSSEIKYYEPKMALKGGTEGIDLLKKIIYLGSKILKRNGLLALEIGDNQFKTIANYLSKNNFKLLTKYTLINRQVRCLVATII